jgi:hypothetical protein
VGAAVGTSVGVAAIFLIIALLIVLRRRRSSKRSPDTAAGLAIVTFSSGNPRATTGLASASTLTFGGSRKSSFIAATGPNSFLLSGGAYNKDVFISIRENEGEEAARVLKTQLVAAGLSVFIGQLSSIGELASTIVEVLLRCKVVVIVGTRGYGSAADDAVTAVASHSLADLQQVLDQRPNELLVVKCCNTFKQSELNRMFGVNQVSVYDWQTSRPTNAGPPPELVAIIVERVQQQQQTEQLANWEEPVLPAEKVDGHGLAQHDSGKVSSRPEAETSADVGGREVVEYMAHQVTAVENASPPGEEGGEDADSLNYRGFADADDAEDGSPAQASADGGYLMVRE